MKYPLPKIWKYTGLIILLVLIALPIFSHLDSVSMNLWDESRLAENSLEMYQNHNWLVTMFDWQPDVWNTKPPLEIWLQVLSMHVFGINELGVRMPSAIAGMLTCLLLIWFFNKKGHLGLGIISCLVLVTSYYTTINHAARSGDYDSVLTFFTTAYCIAYFLFLESGRRKYFNVMVVFIILAALTKGIAGMMMLPGLFIYTLCVRKTMQVLKLPNFYVGAGAFIVLVIGYYFLREHYNPGYIAAVKQNELGGRYNTTLENHKASFWFYYDLLASQRFSAWHLFIIPGIVTGLFLKDSWLKRAISYFAVAAISYWIIISSAATKLEWYDLPMMPLISVLAGVFFYQIYTVLANSDILHTYLFKPALGLIFIYIVMYPPYRAKMDKILLPNNGEEVSQMATYLQGALHGDRNIDGYYFSWTEYHAEQKWYLNIFHLQHRPIYFLEHVPDDMAGKTLGTSDGKLKEYIEQHFINEKIYDYNTVTIYKIKSNKMDSAAVRRSMIQ